MKCPIGGFYSTASQEGRRRRSRAQPGVIPYADGSQGVLFQGRLIGDVRDFQIRYDSAGLEPRPFRSVVHDPGNVKTHAGISGNLE